MVKKDGMILEQYLYDEKAYCLKKQYDGTDTTATLISDISCHYPQTSQPALPRNST